MGQENGSPPAIPGGEVMEHVAGDTGTITAVARARYEMEAAMVLAERRPRSEEGAVAAIKKSCNRVGFALEAEFDFQRGGAPITGPSVKFAREAARCWGHIRYGVNIYSTVGEEVHIRGYAFDAQTGAFAELEDRFRKLIERKGGNWIVPNERQLRELINKRGAILERNCILKCIPFDVVADCIAVTRTTIHKWGAEALKEDRKGAIQLMIQAFKKINVIPEMLDKWLGFEIQKITTEKYVALKRIWVGIDEGQTSVAEHFGDKQAPSASTGTIDPEAGMEPKAAREASTKPQDPGRAAAEKHTEQLRQKMAAKEAEKAAAEKAEADKAEGGGRQGAHSPAAEGSHTAAAPPEASRPEPEKATEPDFSDPVGCHDCGEIVGRQEIDHLDGYCAKCFRAKADKGSPPAAETPADPEGQAELPMPEQQAQDPLLT